MTRSITASGSWRGLRCGRERTIIETGAALHPIALYPLGGGLGRHLESSCSGLQRPRLFDDLLNQPLSTAKAQSGILVNVHSIGPRKLDCSSQSASRVPLEWTTSWKDRGQPERCKSRRATSAPWKSVPLISTFAPLRRLRYCSPSQKEQRLERSQVPHPNLAFCGRLGWGFCTLAHKLFSVALTYTGRASNRQNSQKKGRQGRKENRAQTCFADSGTPRL